MATKKGLGMGMESLLGTKNASKTKTQLSSKNNKSEKNASSNENVEIKDGTIMVDINLVSPNKNQPRKNFDEDKLQELSDSIAEHGIIQPLIVTKQKDTKKNEYYQIVAGERRWRASKMAGLKEVPVIIKEYSDQEKLEIAIIENIQRDDLNAIEEALAYESMIKELKYTQDKLAERLSKSRTAITNSMRLLKLSKKVQNMVIEDKLTAGHVRALLSIEDKNKQYDVAQIIFDKGLSVRETEKLVKKYNNSDDNDDTVKNDNKSKNKTNTAIAAAYKKKESELENILKSKVKIEDKGNKGKIVIPYNNLEDFERIFELISK